ncbi:hypothetical protein DW267_16250 [Bacteroides sp. AM22-3LB]|nr:hypothetical protein DW267_16250 [Bacteroides sp. AM22-3LB]
MSSCHPVLTKQLNVTPQKTKVMKQGTMNILFFVLKTKLLKNGEASELRSCRTTSFRQLYPFSLFTQQFFAFPYVLAF